MRKPLLLPTVALGLTLASQAQAQTLPTDNAVEAAASSPAKPGGSESADIPADTQATDTPLPPAPEKLRKTAPATPMLTGVTGDWGGLRTQLHDIGFDFQLGYTNQFASNVKGPRLGTVDNGQGLFGANVDMDKLAGVKGGKFRVFFIARHGLDLNIHEQLGLLQNLQSVNGRGNVLRLTELWYEQSFGDGKVSVRVGREPTGLEFGASTCDSQNRSFCGGPPGNLPNSYTYWLSYPSSTWMARARVNFGANNSDGYIQTAVYQTNPKQNADATDGLRLSLSGGTGVLVPVELGWTPKLWTDRPGVFKLGGWYESSPTNDIYRDVNGDPIVSSGLQGRRLRGRYGAYIVARQQITPSPKGLEKAGLSAFVNLFKFDNRTSTVDNYVGVGLIQTGTFNGRPDDQIALEFSRTHINSRLARADEILEQTDPLHGVRGSEYAVELDYRIIPMKGLRITPNIQYVANPSGYANRRNVLAFGIMTNISF